MSKHLNRPIEEIAIVVVINALHHAKTKGCDTTFYWITKDTYRLISRRINIHDSHVQELDAKLKEWGWSMAVLPDDRGYAFLFAAPLPNRWPRLGFKRLRDEGVLDLDYDDLEEYYRELTDPEVGLEPFQEDEF